jgi:hypothetical protein
MAAQTQIRLGNLAAADALYGSSIATLERAVEATPSFRDKYNDHLAVVLERAAELKRALGSSADANALDGRAASVPSAAPDAPLPAMRRDGNTILAGSLGPTLNGDDLRQLRALVPAGKETWLITASHELIAPDRRLLAEIYLDPDMEQANLRRGRVITAEAIVKSDAKLDGKKIWTDAKLTIGYAQVALPGRDPMDLRGHDDPNLPALVPQMAAGVSVTHAELVSVVAFIRSASSPSQGAAGFDFGELYKRVQPWPIADITKWSEDNLEVRLVPQTTARRGQRIKLKASGKGWTIVELEPVAW